MNWRDGVVLHSEADRDKAIETLRKVKAHHLPAEMILRPYKPCRSVSQNRRHWGLMSAIAEYMPSHMHGAWHAAEIWHTYFCRRFLGVETIEIAGESVPVPRSSRTLTTAEFKDLDEQIEAHMASEYGWTWE